MNEMSKTLNELNQKLEKEINDAFDELVKMMNDRRNELVWYFFTKIVLTYCEKKLF